MQQNKGDTENCRGWRVLASWQFVVAMAVLTLVGVLARWLEVKTFPVVEVLMLYLAVLVFVVLACCGLLYCRYCRRLESSVDTLTLLQGIIQHCALSANMSETLSPE